MQNTQRASANKELLFRQSTPAEAAEDVWAVWPYCWLIAGWDIAFSCFHSFHTKHQDGRLARNNRRAQAKFWRGWNREASSSELELRLL